MVDKTEVYEFTGPDNTSFGIEISEPKIHQGFTPICRSSGNAPISYQEAIDKVKPAADYLLSTIKNLDAAPQEVEVNFGIKLSTKAGAVIASAAAEGNFSIKLTWKR